MGNIKQIRIHEPGEEDIVIEFEQEKKADLAESRWHYIRCSNDYTQIPFNALLVGVIRHKNKNSVPIIKLIKRAENGTLHMYFNYAMSPAPGDEDEYDILAWTYAPSVV